MILTLLSIGLALAGRSLGREVNGNLCQLEEALDHKLEDDAHAAEYMERVPENMLLPEPIDAEVVEPSTDDEADGGTLRDAF